MDRSTRGMIACMINVPFITRPQCVLGFVVFFFLGGMLQAELFFQHSYVEVLTPVLQNESDFRDRAL